MGNRSLEGDLGPVRQEFTATELHAPGMRAADRFRKAAESWDLEGIVALLAPDVRLHGPATFPPFEGRQAVRQLFTTPSGSAE
jgi:ketosteroid isomerase-like protein